MRMRGKNGESLVSFLMLPLYPGRMGGEQWPRIGCLHMCEHLPHIVSDFEQNFLEQQVPKSNFRSKLPCLTLHRLMIRKYAKRIC